MEFQGICYKMHAEVELSCIDNPQTHVAYRFILDRTAIDQSLCLSQNIEIEWTGNIYCISCGKKTPKSYSQGHCFKCFKTKAECDLCIMKPETCHYHLGTCREESFAQKVCFQPHIIYLANSSALKIGITRINQMPTRWLDQGATQALPIFKVGSRRLSGHLEHLFATQIADKTDWRKLLKGQATPINLIEHRDRLIEHFSSEIENICGKHQNNLDFNESTEYLKNDYVREFIYPIQRYPEKIKSLNLDKTPKIQGKLDGIKGQYLILDTGVINLRKYTGYELIIRMN